MIKKVNEKKIAYFLILFSAVDITYGFLLGFSQTFVEFCNIAPLLLAYGILTKRLYLIHFVALFSALFQIPWTMDWVAQYVGIEFLNLYQTYQGLPYPFLILSFVQHLLTLPVAIYLLYTSKRSSSKKREALYIPLGIILVLALLSYDIGYLENANCIHYTCIEDLKPVLHGIRYTVSWVSIILLTWCVYWKVRLT